MRFRVSHVTSYRYTRPVFLEPHTFRLMPRGGGSQRFYGYDLQITPRPAGFTETLDAENNAVHCAWFVEPTPTLSVASRFEVETLRSNPFDFVLSDLALATLPVSYPEPLRLPLAAYSARPSASHGVYSFARACAQEVEWHTLPFLTALNRKLYAHIDHRIRADGDPHPAEFTLATRSGACRDVAILFIEACRCVGLAARFVSGYELLAAQDTKAHMHAWAEVYLPGGGWRGYDPARGLAVSNGHIALAAASTAQGATPVSGTFRGDSAEAVMDFHLEIAEVS